MSTHSTFGPPDSRRPHFGLGQRARKKRSDFRASGPGVLFHRRPVPMADAVGDETANDALYDELVHLKETIDQFGEGVIIYDQADRVVMWNERFDDIYVMTRPLRKIGETFETLIRAGAYMGQNSSAFGDEEAWISDRLAAHRTGGGVHERRLSDGTWLKVSERRTPSGYMVCIHTDITVLKEREAALRESRQFLQDVIDAVPGVISAKDRDGRMLFINRYQDSTTTATKGQHRGGRTRGRSAGPSPAPIPGLKGDANAAGDRMVIETGQALPPFETTFSAGPNTSQTWLMTKSPLHCTNGEVRGIVTVALDITEHKELERRQRRSRRLETVSRITGGFAHDFNNLLAALNHHLDAARRNASADAPALLAEIDAARHASERASDITKRLLAFGRRQNTNPRELDVGLFLTGVRQFLAATFDGAPRIRLSVAKDIAAVVADPAELEMAILNLALNARDACGKNSTITLRAINWPAHNAPASSTKPGAAQHTTDGRAGSPRVAIEVLDNGHGMSTDILTRATEPFFSTKAAKAGTGLGLSMVEAFIEQSGGTLQIESRVGKGTRVRLLLPTVRLPPVSAARPRAKTLASDQQA